MAEKMNYKKRDASDETKMMVAGNIKYFLAINRKTQMEAAKDLGITQSTFNTWCIGTSIPSIDKLEAVAKYLHCTIADLVLSPVDIEQRKESTDNVLAHDPTIQRTLRKLVQLPYSDQHIVIALIERMYESTPNHQGC